MKLFSTLLLASLSSANGQGAQLLARWDMNEPTTSFEADTNTFVFDYVGTSPDNVGGTGVTQHVMYSYDCKDDGTFTAQVPPVTEVVVTDGVEITEQLSTTTPAHPQLRIKITPKTLANNNLIYDVLTQDWLTAYKAANNDENPPYTSVSGYGDFASSEDLGKGLAHMCLRYGIGKTVTGFYEINFIETLIEVKYDLTAGFSVDGFSVAPKNREVVTEIKSDYTLEAYLCNPASTDTPEDFNGNTYVWPTADPQAAGTAFNQGALIKICIKPIGQTRIDGLYLEGITSYTWKLYDEPGTSEITGVTQGIDDGLSYMSCFDVNGSDSGNGPFDYCTIESILYADFYKVAGTVKGSGEATLDFGAVPAARLLKAANSEEEARKLQEAPSAEFDVSVSVSNDAEGPGALKTAGGISLNASAFATLAALLSAIMLA
ncbi:unnamed protein product [Pseudo-nitzschia multistriata]|uniref:Uncharacterized protein n=1 Tax=Pseudo-nitzschia multistriata TaxID=183589 RepID=A0A448ZQR9_9STRA|nr:unnamed protein product [Pseudo-nitzschia multistriata]